MPYVACCHNVKAFLTLASVRSGRNSGSSASDSLLRLIQVKMCCAISPARPNPPVSGHWMLSSSRWLAV